jgi:hypothetical protein
MRSTHLSRTATVIHSPGVCTGYKDAIFLLHWGPEHPNLGAATASGNCSVRRERMSLELQGPCTFSILRDRPPTAKTYPHTHLELTLSYFCKAHSIPKPMRVRQPPPHALAAFLIPKVKTGGLFVMHCIQHGARDTRHGCQLQPARVQRCSCIYDSVSRCRCCRPCCCPWQWWWWCCCCWRCCRLVISPCHRASQPQGDAFTTSHVTGVTTARCRPRVAGVGTTSEAMSASTRWRCRGGELVR